MLKYVIAAAIISEAALATSYVTARWADKLTSIGAGLPVGDLPPPAPVPEEEHPIRIEGPRKNPAQVKEIKDGVRILEHVDRAAGRGWPRGEVSGHQRCCLPHCLGRPTPVCRRTAAVAAKDHDGLRDG